MYTLLGYHEVSMVEVINIAGYRAWEAKVAAATPDDSNPSSAGAQDKENTAPITTDGGGSTTTGTATTATKTPATSSGWWGGAKKARGSRPSTPVPASHAGIEPPVLVILQVGATCGGAMGQQ
jgi:hypothetical protein